MVSVLQRWRGNHDERFLKNCMSWNSGGTVRNPSECDDVGEISPRPGLCQPMQCSGGAARTRHHRVGETNHRRSESLCKIVLALYKLGLFDWIWS